MVSSITDMLNNIAVYMKYLFYAVTTSIPKRKKEKVSCIMYRRLPLYPFRISRYYHLCRNDFSFPTFFYIYLCISTLYVSKTVNMKQRVSRSDFSCPRHIIYYICYCLCRSQKSAQRAPYCLLRLCIRIT